MILETIDGRTRVFVDLRIDQSMERRDFEFSLKVNRRKRGFVKFRHAQCTDAGQDATATGAAR
ncbi:hypothetical protein A2U01_0104685 [Trifolium medium]|uniref:Uncharacterized protein n=1 Tax=Trifolium medium TaxID=97028 RepID=A0A392V820_9FABA|nr:hypothetical protein [Trifolium medium]